MHYFLDLCKPKKKEDLNEEVEQIVELNLNNEEIKEASKPIKNLDFKSQLALLEPSPQQKHQIENDQPKQNCHPWVNWQPKLLPTEQFQINKKIKVISKNNIPEDQINPYIQAQYNLAQKDYNPYILSPGIQNYINDNAVRQNQINQQAIQSNQFNQYGIRSNQFNQQQSHQIIQYENQYNQINEIYKNQQDQISEKYSNKQDKIDQYQNPNNQKQNTENNQSHENDVKCQSENIYKKRNWEVDYQEYLTTMSEKVTPQKSNITTESKARTCTQLCEHCKNEVQNNYVQLNCYHCYCQECLKERLKMQISQPKTTFFHCLCGMKIKPQQIWDRKPDLRIDRFADMLKKQLYVNQAENIADQLKGQKNYQQCSKCDFFVLKDNNYPSEFYCLSCGKNTN